MQPAKRGVTYYNKKKFIFVVNLLKKSKMKRVFYLFPLLVLFVFSSCSKEAAEKMECETLKIGYVTITNTSVNPYKIYIDGDLKFELSGNTFRDDVKVSAGFHTFKAVQVDGYVLFPTVRETTFSTWICEKRSWVIP